MFFYNYNFFKNMSCYVLRFFFNFNSYKSGFSYVFCSFIKRSVLRSYLTIFLFTYKDVFKEYKFSLFFDRMILNKLEDF